MIRRYSELTRLGSYSERLSYLMLTQGVGMETFGFDRYLNQALYHSREWKDARRFVILRDNGMDIAIDGIPIVGRPVIHHMNPISEEQIIDRDPDIFNPEFLICVSHKTHNRIHYGFDSEDNALPIERSPGDTCPWR